MKPESLKYPSQAYSHCLAEKYIDPKSLPVTSGELHFKGCPYIFGYRDFKYKTFYFLKSVLND